MIVSDLCAGYRNTDVLKNLTFTVPDGSLTGIIGPNGCGKSTLLKTLAGILPVHSGTIRYTASSELQPKSLAKTAAYMPQMQDSPDIPAELFVSYGRFPHLTFPRRLTARDQEIIAHCMHLTGTDSYRGRILSTLSGGERQRVFLAQVLAQDTPYLLLDEPNTHMDIRHTLSLMSVVRSLQDKTVLMVLHDLELALQYCDRLLVLRDGTLLGEGTPQEVLDAGWIENAFDISVVRRNGIGFSLPL